MSNRYSPDVPRLAILVTASVLLFVTTPGADAAKRAVRRAPAGGGGGGGVYLQTPEPRTPIEHNNRAVELGSKGLWPQAIKEHEIALAADPHNKEFRTNLSAAQLRYGDLLLSRGDTYNAMKQYRGALYVDPNNTPADEHLDECLRRIKKNPDDVKVRMHMAEDAETSGDYETAIVEYRKCVKMSDDGPAHANLARVLLKAGKVVDGFTELKIAVAKPWPNDKKSDLAEAHRQLGDILKEYAYIAKSDGRGTVGMKRLLNAGIEYRRAVTINPNNLDAARSLVEVSREAVAIAPSFDNYMMLGGAYQLIADFERAKMAYEDAWKANPNSPALPVARKSFYLSVMKNPQTSPAMLAGTLQKVQEAINKNPNDAELWYVYGRGKEAQQDTGAAMEAYQRAAAINPHVNPDLQAGIKRLGGASAETAPTKVAAAAAKATPAKQDETAKLLAVFAEIEKKVRDGQVDEAQKQLLQMVEKDAKLARAWYLLGVTHEKKGDLDQAGVAYRQASYLKDPDAEAALRQINTSRVQPMLEEGDRAAKENNWVKAASSYREAVSIAPNLSLVHRKLAEALRQLGDTKEADRELKKAAELEK
jgi:tetratricopeptide (TPR) repeat protein